MLSKKQKETVQEHVDSIKCEYGEYPDAELLEEYLQCANDLTPAMKDAIAIQFGL